jgi:tetratricopeptide (TPR) repeat protein
MHDMKTLLIYLSMAALSVGARAQSGRGEIREGNRHFRNEKFTEAEASYRKAGEGKEVAKMAEFNLGDALYRQEKFEDAARQFESAASSDMVKSNSAKAWHNLGNSLLQGGKVEESIEAYKHALRISPTDLDTKYNLSYAQMLKKKQEQQQKQEGQNDKNDKNDQNKDQQKQDQKDQQEKDQQQQQQDQQKQDEQKQDQKLQNGQQNMKMSEEDAKRLLEALASDEKKVQEKVKKEKANAARVRTLKDW